MASSVWGFWTLQDTPKIENLDSLSLFSWLGLFEKKKNWLFHWERLLIGSQPREGLVIGYACVFHVFRHQSIFENLTVYKHVDVKLQLIKQFKPK